MDPVSHAALGHTLVAALRGAPDGVAPRAAVVAAVLGALSPDLDFVLMPFGWDIYLRVHEIGTHTVVGTACCAAATAGAVRLFANKTAYRALFGAAWLGAASHVVLDLLSSATLRPGWPFVDSAISVPIVAMADPWLLAACAAGPLLIAAAGLRVSATKKRAAWIALAVMAAFLAIKGARGILAYGQYENAVSAEAEQPTARLVEARWASLDTWQIFDRTPTALRSWHATASGGARQMHQWPIDPESPAVSASRALPAVRNFLDVHALGFAVTAQGENGHTIVLWSDIRFCRDPVDAGNLPVTVEQNLEGRPIACALWFGGELDAALKPLQQIVRVGRITQRRDADW